MAAQSFTEELLAFINRSPTPFHAVEQMVAALKQAGFEQLDEAASWRLDGFERNFIVRNDSSIVAVQGNPATLAESGMTMIGAHTDSPCLRVKPRPDLYRHGFYQLGVEVYGGALLNPWFDRDLSIAGRVHFQDPQGNLQYRLIDFARPVAVVPSLAIHLDREVNENRRINAQQHLPPVLLLHTSSVQYDNQDGHIKALISEQISRQNPDCDVEHILGFELSLYDYQAAAWIGIDREFISGARLDNLVSCFTGMQAILANPDQPALLVCNDHEEVGSTSFCGADSNFLRSVMQRLLADPQQLSRCLHHSLFISCDNAHGIHPNYADRHDANHGPALNGGPVIKINSNQRYASNSHSVAAFIQACRAADVPYQHFVVRSDMACGSTIGPITAGQLGVDTVDVGVPQLAMHSIREMAGSQDAYHLKKALSAIIRGKRT